MTGDELLRVLATLANPHRLRVVAALAAERNYVSQLARELDISRALLQVQMPAHNNPAQFQSSPSRLPLESRLGRSAGERSELIVTNAAYVLPHALFG
jgi:DNA-binding transcriptional ArsR family regulator